MNIHVQDSLWTHAAISFTYTPRVKLLRHTVDTCSFIRDYQIPFKSGCIIFTLTQAVSAFQCSTALLTNAWYCQSF